MRMIGEHSEFFFENWFIVDSLVSFEIPEWMDVVVDPANVSL